jgi:phage shock protein C
VTERLYRHPTDRAIAGVAAGIAVWLNIDPTIVRVAWVLLAIFSGGVFVLVYIVMMIVVPLPPPGWTPRPRDPGWGAPTGGWSQPGQGTWGPTAAPGGAPNPSPGWGETPQGGWSAAPQGGWSAAPQGGWDQPASPAWGDPAAGTAAASGTGAAGATPGWQRAARPGNAGIVVGIVLVVVGIWFLVDQYVSIDWDLVWPVVVMVIGGALIAGALLRRRDG